MYGEEEKKITKEEAINPHFLQEIQMESNQNPQINLKKKYQCLAGME